MYTVYYARSYATKQEVAFCKNYESAMERAREEYDMYSRDVCVFDNNGKVVCELKEELLVDEL
jgi:hypothetical protein